jgi:hypothetical protein
VKYISPQKSINGSRPENLPSQSIVNCNSRGMNPLIKESHLHEVMNMKMQMIHCGSIVNLIQIKLMKVIYNLKNMKNQEFEQWEGIIID